MGTFDIFHTPFDAIANAIRGIDYPHSEVHGGSAFKAHYTQTVSDTNDKSIIAFKTGAGPKEVHMSVSAQSSAAATAYILEAPTITNNAGDSLTVYNRYRKSTKASTVIDTSDNPNTVGQAIFFTETTMGEVTSGTIVDLIPLGAGAGPKTIGGTARGTQEWILKVDTNYAFIVDSSTNDDNIHWLQCDWYEHTPR